ncbi:Calmodulin-2 [Dispira simplex]|nr:Calmodulin-2 [Dispira simplex]
MVTILSNNSVAQLKASFALFDKDGDNAITVNELGQVLNELSQTLTEKELKEIVTLADTDGNGQLDFKEFEELLKKDTPAVAKLVKEIEVRLAFKAIDTDKSESISRDELREALKGMNKPCSEEQLDKLLKEVDANGDGLIDLREFCQLYHKL